MAANTEERVGDARGARLRRELTIWSVIGVSVATVAPSLGANINPQGAIPLVGRAVPLTLILATGAVLLVTYSFARLSQHVSHAGSAYALVGITLGARSGAVAGWTLFGAYLCYAIINFIATGIFLTAFLTEVGIWSSPADAPWIIALVQAVIATYLACVPIRKAGRALFIIELTTVALITLVAVVVLVRVSTGHAPAGQSFTLDMFTLPSGTKTSDLFLALVFGFLYFAGYESAATLGEETTRPKRDIPRALFSVALVGGIFFVCITAIEMLGFGTSKASVARAGSSSSLLGDLGRQYIAGWIGDLITLGVTASAFACSIACVVAASRMLFAIARDASDHGRLSDVSSRTGAPVAAAVLIGVVGAIVTLFGRLVWTSVPIEYFSWVATVGTLGVLVVYALVTIGSIRFLFFDGEARRPRWELVIPVAGTAVIAYVLYRNLWPVPAGTGKYFPYVAAAWIVVGIVGVFAMPRLAERFGARLAADMLPAEPVRGDAGV